MTKGAKKTSSWASSRKEMPKKVCKKLIGADPNLGWKLAGEMVIKRLLGSDVVPVSCPEDSACFDLGTILVKDHQSLTAKAAHRHTTLRAIGTVEGMSVSAPANLRTILTPKADENWEAPPSGFPWTYTIGNEHDGERKRFYVKVGDVKKEVVHLTLKKGDLRLQLNNNDDLRKAKAVYIVTEAFYASSLKVEVTVDDRQGSFFTEDKILIGFRYQKFKLSKTGVVGPELSTNIKRNRRVYFFSLVAVSSSKAQGCQKLEAHLFVKTSYAERVKKPVNVAELRKPSNTTVDLSHKASLPGMTDDAAEPKSTKDESKECWVSAVSDVTDQNDRCEVMDLDQEQEQGDEGAKAAGKKENHAVAAAEHTQSDDAQCSVG
uniref:Uncharacterized protein n=2 Tax=Branchiostoma floridae TaxID=7739 RepID=C3XW31_BRAFL|eukprot:XP_002611555.1 hypothetical protein BRAFLDRAFT_117181 [Branchiostoma floridae]